jgi:hypothetical protein
MTAKQPDNEHADDEVKHFGMVKPEDQDAMISFHRAIAADTRVPKADRQFARERADALEKQLRPRKKPKKRR